ncbi:MAG: hypothetical protein AAGH72_03780 [Verrucomicrobiota bacterium]
MLPLRAIILLQLWMSIVVSWVQAEHFESVVQTKSKEFYYGKHPVLQADVVELEFNVEKTKSKTVNLAPSRVGKNRNDTLSQNFGFEYRIMPNDYLMLKQGFKVGVAKRHDANEGYFNEQTEDHWTQIQLTELALMNESKSVQLKMFQQYRQVFHAERELPDAFFKYGGRMDIRLTRSLSVSPEWSKEERTDYRLQRTDRERYGARLSWMVSRQQGITLKPEAYTERRTDHRGQPRDRQGAGIAIVKTFPKQKISLQIKPLYIEEHVDVGHSGNQQIERLYASVAWNPAKEFSMRTGGIFERQTYYIQHRETSNETLYSSMVHRPLDDFSVSFRGDYRLKSQEHDLAPYRNADDSQIKVSVTPEYQINDALVASAQYLYEYRTPNKNIENPEAQVVTVSLRGEF